MPGADLSALEQRYGLPPGILAATRSVESGGDPNAVSSKGAIGHFQFMPDTARSLGIDPRDPQQAAEGAARLWAENLKATGGDIDMAARYYQGGPDKSKWGAQNAAYPGKILAALQKGGNAPAPADAPKIDSYINRGGGGIDDYLSRADGDKSAGDDGLPAPAVDPVPYRNGDSNGGDIRSGVHNPGQNGNTPPQPGGSPGSGILDAAQGFLQGVASVPKTAEAALDAVARRIGVDEDLIKSAGQSADSGIFNSVLPAWLAPAANMLTGAKPGDSTAYHVGRFGGEAAATLPLAEMKLLGATKLSEGGKLAQALAKYGDYALQGAAAGAATSEGNDVMSRAATGAALAPVIGATVEKALVPLALKIPGVKKLGDAVRAKINAPKIEPAAAPEPDVIPDRPAWLGEPKVVKAADGTETVIYGQADEPGIRGTVTDDAGAPPPVPATPAPPQATPDQLAAAIGARQAKSGIEATRDLPPAVAERAAQLESQGVPAGEALRQADIEAIGAKPTVAHVKRTPGDMQALTEGAKLTTPEGNALSQQIADNNAAVHAKAQGMVADNGGVPAQGDAAQTAAQALAEASDAARAKVNEAYTAARALDGDKRVDIAALRETLDTPRFRASPIWQGLRTQIDEMSKVNGGKFSPDEIDQLTQIVNDQYDPMGSGVNGMVGELKGALNKSLDLFDNASAAFKQARALHRQWAEQYDDPAGVARLIKRDAKGNFLNEDNWRAAEGFVGTQSDKAFIQIVRQLRANGSADALSRLKATVLQRAYERAASGPADRMGNATFNGRAWNDALNRIGKAKLEALFSREEIADLAHVGRAAAHMHEAIPGTANTSNSASAVINELDRRGVALPKVAKGAARIVGHGLAAITHPVVGNVAVEGALGGAEHAVGGRNSARLAKAMTEFMDPDAARAAEVQRASAELEARRNKELARVLASFSAPQGGNSNGRSH